MSGDLFGSAPTGAGGSTAELVSGADGGPDRPLADRLRPSRLEDVIGQAHLLGPDGPLGRMLAAGRLDSIILWGPPGCGKTTIARLLARQAGLAMEPLSAVMAGVADLRKVFERARERRRGGQGTLLFIDEVHRFNKAQQDSLLPHLEDGTVTLIGATTENPSFELNRALLSRAQVLILARLDAAALGALIERAEAALAQPLPITAAAREALIAMADGDGRYLLSLCQVLADVTPAASLEPPEMGRLLQRRAAAYDKDGDGHYGLISALHKSVRGSDPDAALYWLARMLGAGEDPHFLGRRMLRMASEDIGLADPQALTVALAAWQSYERLGSPEGELALAEACVYLATAPKSNALYTAYKAVTKRARETGSVSPPQHILNAPTPLMREIGHGAGYDYDHEAPDAFSGQDYFPDDMAREVFYEPVERGFERDIRKRLQYWARLRQSRSGE